MEVGFLQETKSILKSLVLSSPNGMTLERLNRDYREMVGNWIPFQKLGFSNLELFLRSISDTLVVTGHGLQARIGFIANEKVNHINEMVSRQKNTTRQRKSAVIQKSQNAIVQSVQQSQLKGPNKKQPIFNTTYCGFSKSSNSPPSRRQQNDNNANKHHMGATPKQNGVYDVRHKSPIVPKANNFQTSKNTNHFTCKTKAVSLDTTSEPYKEKISSQEKTSDNLRRPSNLLDSENNNLNTSGSNRLNKIVFAKEVSKENAADRCNGNTTRTSFDQSSAIREKEITVSSNTIIFPNKAVLPKATARDAVSKIITKTVQSDLEAINPFSQNDVNESDDFDEAVPEFAANGLVFQVDFPEHTVGFGQKIPRLKLPSELVKGAVIGVFISEIHSPFKFWFHIYKENHELDILMNRIECFYSRLSVNELIIPKNCLAPGQICAALYNEMWHRAEVLNNVCNNKVKVNFFDYGTVSEIEIHNIKYLPVMFSHTPMQAIRGSLSHIKPVSSLWPKSAVRAFLSMVSEILLYAQVMDIDENDQTVYMVLCDTNGSETVQINKQMVDKGHAKLDSEWDEHKIKKNGYRKRHPRDIFPTFEMLETGEYPSLSELENLLAQGIDYEALTEKIILFKVNNNNEYVLRKDYANNVLSFNLLDTNPFKNDIISEILSLKIFGD